PTEPPSLILKSRFLGKGIRIWLEPGACKGMLSHRHELPCLLPEHQIYTCGKKYRQLACTSPNCISCPAPRTHPSCSANSPCSTSTSPWSTRSGLPSASGTRELCEECQEQHMECVPVCLPLAQKEKEGDQMHSSGPPRPREAFWEPMSSDHGTAVSDSEDSTTHLHLPELFTRKDQGGTEHGDSTDDFLPEEEGEKPRNPGEKSPGAREEMEVDRDRVLNHHHKPKSFSTFKQVNERLLEKAKNKK
uniref:Uncharacterized protein n=1 Tax=Panthera leo TaxID=9689 RepID=A0A8C8WHH3_PANLE